MAGLTHRKSYTSFPACAQYKCQWDVFGFLLFLYACFTLLVWVSDLRFILDLVVLMASSMEISVPRRAARPTVGTLGLLKVGFSSHHRKIFHSIYSVAAPHTVRDLKLITFYMGVPMYFMSLTPCFNGGIRVGERNQTKLMKTEVWYLFWTLDTMRIIKMIIQTHQESSAALVPIMDSLCDWNVAILPFFATSGKDVLAKRTS